MPVGKTLGALGGGGFCLGLPEPAARTRGSSGNALRASAVTHTCCPCGHRAGDRSTCQPLSPTARASAPEVRSRSLPPAPDVPAVRSVGGRKHLARHVAPSHQTATELRTDREGRSEQGQAPASPYRAAGG